MLDLLLFEQPQFAQLSEFVRISAAKLDRRLTAEMSLLQSEVCRERYFAGFVQHSLFRRLQRAADAERAQHRPDALSRNTHADDALPGVRADAHDAEPRPFLRLQPLPQRQDRAAEMSEA